MRSGTRGGTVRQFLVGKQIFGHHCPVGRGTKGYVALELPAPGLKKARLCFLKDYWRPLGGGIHSELETYERLRVHGVTRVPTAIAGGDVVHANGEKQLTVTQCTMEDEAGPPVERSHYRVVTLEVGRPLETFENFNEFIIFVLDALIGESTPCDCYPLHLIAFCSAQLMTRLGIGLGYCTVTSAGLIS